MDTSVQLASELYQSESLIDTAILGLVVHEFLITISDEIRTVWKQPVTVSAVLLGSVRWCMLLLAIMQLSPSSPQTCKYLSVFVQILYLVGFVQTALFSALRVFAISDKSYRWSLPVLVLGLVPFGTNMTDRASIQYRNVPGPFVGGRCVLGVPSARTGKILAYATRSSLVIADMIVLVQTWIRTFKFWKYAHGGKARTPLMTCLLRDGTVYFAVLLAVNLAHITTYNLFAIKLSPMAPFITTLPSVLINRFMINLRSEPSPLHFSSRLSRCLGNFGGTLHDGLSNAPDEGTHDAEREDAGSRRADTSQTEMDLA